MDSSQRRRGALLAGILLALIALPPIAPGPHAIAAETAKAAAPAKKASAKPRRAGNSAASTDAACLGRALGGLENIARVSTLFLRYQYEAGGLKGTDVFWRDVRGAVRESLDVPGAFSTLVVFDGARGWRRGPNGAVLSLSGVDLADQVTDAYLGSYMHVVPGRIPGKVERLGLDRPTGLVKLRVQPQGGTPVTLLLDTLTCLPARIVQSSGDGTQAVYLRDWRVVGGIKVPFAMRRSTGDSATDVRLTLLDARVDARFPAGAFARPLPLGPQPSIAGGARSVELPFELVSNKPFLDVEVGGHSMRFLFDTGSPGMLIDRDRAKAIGLTLEGKFQTGGAGAGTLEQAFAKNVEFAVGALHSPGMTFAAAPLGGSAPAEGCELSGLIGYDLASRFVVDIDYQAGRFRFHDPAQWSYHGKGAAVAYSLIYGGLMVVPATITLAGGDSVAGRFLVDTGVRHALMINRPFAEKHKLESRLPAGREGAVGYGLGGETRGRVTRAAALRIGGLGVRDPVLVLSLDAKGALASTDFDGIIGGDLLRRCRVIFDHPRQRILLEPNASFAGPFDYDMSGTFLLAQGDDFKQFLVWRVFADSPATDAGLAEGDVITSVDGTPAGKLTLEEVRRALRAGEREVELGVRRGEKALTLRLKLRRLV
jgi:Aspartyl protease/PDZ domain